MPSGSSLPQSEPNAEMPAGAVSMSHPTAAPFHSSHLLQRRSGAPVGREHRSGIETLGGSWLDHHRMPHIAPIEPSRQYDKRESIMI